MPALPARHIVQTLFFAARRHDQAFGLAELRSGHARHVRVAGQLVGRCGQPGPQRRHRHADRMRDACRVALAPGGLRQRRAGILVSSAIARSTAASCSACQSAWPGGSQPAGCSSSRRATTAGQRALAPAALAFGSSVLQREVGAAVQQVVQRPHEVARQAVTDRVRHWRGHPSWSRAGAGTRRAPDALPAPRRRAPPARVHARRRSGSPGRPAPRRTRAAHRSARPARPGRRAAGGCACPGRSRHRPAARNRRPSAGGCWRW